MNKTTLTVVQIAAEIGADISGNPTIAISRLASLMEAEAGDLSFLSSARYQRQLEQTRASAVIVSRTWKGNCDVPVILRVDDPDKALVEVAQLFAPPPPQRYPGIHPTAVIDDDVILGEDLHIGPYCVIESGATVGDRSIIEAQCFIGQNVRLGADSHLYPQVTIRERVTIGERFIAHNGVVIGSDGFGYNVTPQPGALPIVTKIPQVGTVTIGHDVEIGANSTVDRARFGITKIGNHVKIDNLVQIGHNVHIGDCSGIIAQAGVAGSTRVGAGVMIWAQAGISGHLTIGDGAQVGPQAGVARDVAAGTYVIGSPAGSLREMTAASRAARNIGRLRKKIAELEERLDQSGGEPIL